MAAQARSIGVISNDLGGYYFGAMINGIHQATRSAGVPLVVIQQTLGALRLPAFGAEHIAGWIVLHPYEADRANLEALCATSTPVVMAPVPLAGSPPCTLVQVDNRGGMGAAVLHLIDHGHRRIAYIHHGPQSWSKQRYQGYCDALAARDIAYDPDLVIDLDVDDFDDATIHQQRGVHAARHLLERGMPCTALAAATDTCALTTMQIIQAAGYHVPEDLAIVGFDDIAEAQYASPPLTTVRSQFDAIGRAAAERLLVEMRGGQPAQPAIISVPTVLLHRRSCGCTALNELLSDEAASHDDPAGWQAALAQQLVRAVRYPLPLDPAIPATQVWPGAGALVAMLDETLLGRQPDLTAVELAWQQAIAQTENLEALHTALTLLEDTAEERLATAPSARPAVLKLLRRVRLELFRTRLAYEAAPKQLLGEQVRANYAVSMALLSGGEEARTLGWLAHTPAAWGCLGLWDDQSANRPATLAVAGSYSRSTPATALGQQLPVSAFPPIDQLPAHIQQGEDLVILCPIQTQLRDWGVLALSGWSAQSLTTGTGNLRIQATLLGVTLDRNTVLSTLTAQQSTLHAAYDRERMLSQTIRELGCPVIPLLPGVLLVPLIGALDSERAQQIIGNVLGAIGEQHAHTVFLDITGVPVVDTQVASSLIQTAQAATLLGAQVAMVGIRPEIAQSIVGLGIDLRHLRMYSTLANALQQLQRAPR